MGLQIELEKEAARPPQEGHCRLSTPEMLSIILAAYPRASDIIFSPGHPPQVGVAGQLTPVELPGTRHLSAHDTSRIAQEVIGRNTSAGEQLREQGSCDLSYSVFALSRFRVNIFMQRGSYAMVLRVIPYGVPTTGVGREIGSGRGILAPGLVVPVGGPLGLHAPERTPAVRGIS